ALQPCRMDTLQCAAAGHGCREAVEMARCGATCAQCYSRPGASDETSYTHYPPCERVRLCCRHSRGRVGCDEGDCEKLLVAGEGCCVQDTDLRLLQRLGGALTAARLRGRDARSRQPRPDQAARRRAIRHGLVPYG